MKSLCLSKYFIFGFVFVLASLFVPVHPHTHAAVSGGVGQILLSPANTTLPIGTATPVDIMFNTANVPVSGLQVVLTFTVANPVDLVASIQTNSVLSDDGWSFPIKTVTTSGNTTTIQIMALNLNAEGYATNTNKKLATISFTSSHAFTNKAVVFDQTLTKMLKKTDASDIAAIPSNGGYSTSGTAHTPTPTQPGATATLTPTPTQPGATATLTPTATPGQANKVPTCSALTSNMTTVTGAATLTLTCTGSDTDGTITAADFTFGDGQSTIVESNVGSIGSISTNHYYNTIGSIKASCKVKDNTGTWSTQSGACERILSFKPKATATPTPIRSYGDRGQTPTPIRYSGQVLSPTATPIRIVGSVITDMPADPNIEDPATEPTLYPEEENQEIEEAGSNAIWWIIGGIVAIILAFLLLRRKGPPPPPTGQVPIATV